MNPPTAHRSTSARLPPRVNGATGKPIGASPKPVAAAGHTVGAHTWSHANLNGKKLNDQQKKDEIEKGFSAVKWALGD